MKIRIVKVPKEYKWGGDLDIDNASKWHHAFGGELNTNGADFSTGLTFIDNGGLHEEINSNYRIGETYDVTEKDIKILKKLGYEFEYM